MFSANVQLTPIIKRALAMNDGEEVDSVVSIHDVPDSVGTDIFIVDKQTS